MPDVFFDDYDSLVSAIKSRSRAVLEEYVAPVVKEILLESIKLKIYDAYTPREGAWVGGETYKRRHVLEDSLVIEFEDDGGDDVLVVTSDADASEPIVPGYSFVKEEPGSFLKLLESGKMGIWRRGFARPAVGNAQLKVKDNSDIEAAIEQGFNSDF